MRNILIDKIKEILKGINFNTIGDLGCGNITYSELFPNAKITGFDINQNIVLYKKIKSNPNINFKFKNLNINQEIGKFDLVIASLSLHFLRKESIEKLFEEIKKSKYFLVAHLDKRIDILPDFVLSKSIKFETEKETHSGLPEHTHKIILDLYSL